MAGVCGRFGRKQPTKGASFVELVVAVEGFGGVSDVNVL